MQQATLTFHRFEIAKALFDRMDQKGDEFTINITRTTRHLENDKNHFVCELYLEIRQAESTFNFDILSFGEFTINGEVPENIYKNYTEISGPSIIYPYLRAFVSSMSLQAGMKAAIVIPTINFATLPSVPPGDVPTIAKL